ncbi:MAG: transporter permease [Frankiales bacterium]|nr:transporter permease [Frankiales bacterium]
MTTFLALTVSGLVLGCVYALTATGLVVTYTTSGVFNFAHGATGMVAAFSYWQLTVAWGLPTWLGMLLVLGVLAPLFGFVVEVVLVRPLYRRSAEAPLVATLGLLLILIGTSFAIWDPGKTRRLPLLFAGRQWDLGVINVSYHQVAVVVVTVAVGIGLRVFFTRTLLGIAMRAVVDDRELAAVYGARPERVAQASWAVGTSLAALSGILLAPLADLQVYTMTLLIINAFAAALAGRLKSIPKAVTAALAIQLAVGYVGQYLPTGELVQRIVPSLPMIALFVIVVLTRQDRIVTSGVRSSRAPRLPGARESAGWAAAFVAVVAVAAPLLSIATVGHLGEALASAVILLSLVLVVGYGGQVSLCQLTFAGLSALTMSEVGHGWLGAACGVAVATIAGLLVALPTVRLRGLYLALATLAFAQAMDGSLFNTAFGTNSSVAIARLSLPALDIRSDRGFLVFSAVIFAGASLGLLATRRSKFGRRLAALNDSTAACSTLGIDVTRHKLAVFGASAALAGVGGVLYAGSHVAVGPMDFQLFSSMTLLLLLLIGERTMVSGALFSALLFSVLLPELTDALRDAGFSGYNAVTFLVTGLLVLRVARDPRGVMGQLADLAGHLRPARAVRLPVAQEAGLR